MGKESSLYEIMLDGKRYLGYMIDEKETDDAEYSNKVVSGSMVTGIIKFLVNAND